MPVPRNVSVSLVASLLLGFASVAWPADPVPPTVPSPENTPPAPVVQDAAAANAPGLSPYWTGTQPGGVWGNLTDQHQVYMHQIDGLLKRTGGPTAADALDLAEHDPRGGCPWHFFADGGINMVHSYFSSNPAFQISRRQGTGPSATTITRAPAFDYDVDFAPRASVGVINNEGLGFRMSWWRLDEYQTLKGGAGGSPFAGTVVSSAPVFGVPSFRSPGRVAQQLGIFNDQVAFTNKVRLQVWDWEGLWNRQGESWGLLYSGGLRYGYLSEGYLAFRSNSGTATVGRTRNNLMADADTISSGRNFGGVGPTGALEVRRRLGRSRVSLYGLARGSLLFGHGKTSSLQQTVLNQQSTVGSARPTTTFNVTNFQGSTGGQEVIEMGDFEGGVDWTLTFGRLLTFARVGVVNETWFNSGSATSGRGDTGFFGMRFTAGLSY